MEKKVPFAVDKDKKLTQLQAEILSLITKEFATQKQIASRRKTSVRAVAKIVTKLRNKGYLKKGYEKGSGIGGGSSCTIYKGLQRLHNQQFVIKILEESVKYEEMRKKSNTVLLQDQTIKLHEGKIEVYSSKSFFGKTAREAEEKSWDFWWRFFIKLENLLKVNLVRDGKMNVRQVRGHVGAIDSEIAKDYEEKRKQLRVKGKDGVYWALTDNSFKLHELEMIHPERHVEDMDDVIAPRLNDWRNHPETPLPSEFYQMLLKIGNVQSVEVTKMGNYAQHIENHVAAIVELGEGVKKLSSVIDELKGVVKKEEEGRVQRAHELLKEWGW